MIFFFFHYQTWGSIRLISNRLKYLDLLFSHSLSLFSSEYFDIFFFFGGFGSVKLFVDLSELSMGFVNFVRLLICLILIWSFFCCWIFSMNYLVFTTHLIFWVDFAFESNWFVCIFVFFMCVYVYILCVYIGSTLPSPAKDFGWHDPSFIHIAVMTGLQPSSNFSYKYGRYG